MKLKPIKEDGAWWVVSTIYEPVRKGSVGSGVIFLKRHRTREDARVAIRTGRLL